MTNGDGSPRRQRGPGLRARITLAFTLGALLLSALLAGTTYVLTRENFIRQNEQVAVHQATLRALQVSASLDITSGSPDDAFAGTDADPSIQRLLLLPKADPTERDRYIVSPIAAQPADLPDALVARAKRELGVKMRGEYRDQPALFVGIRLVGDDVSYFEIIPLTDLEAILTALSASLAAAGLVTTLAGAALGIWASRRVLTPLTEVTEAAAAIAGGRLDTRLPTEADPDLSGLITSFNDMAQALQDRIQTDAQFASNVSHELRSPLMTLAASIEVLGARRDEMPERARAALDLMVADVHRFQGLVEDLLEISKADTGALRMEMARVRIGQLVLHAVDAAMVTDEDELPIDLAADAADAEVMVDKRRMVRVLANLLDNAQKYGGGATRVAIEIHAEAPSDGADPVPRAARIVVEDGGPGVDPEDRLLIFQRFRRGGAHAGQRGAGEGVGLGLALVAEHVRLHGGRVWVEDRPGDQPGARFVVELPLAEALAPDPLDESARPDEGVSAGEPTGEVPAVVAYEDYEGEFA